MKKNNTIIAIALFLLISLAGVAQTVVTPPPPQQPPPPGLPIDSGVVILVVLGVIYGAYKIISSRKTSKV